jgi:hypothetical protein
MIMESTNEKTLFEVSEIQLLYKSKVKASLRPKMSSSREAENTLRQYWSDDLLELSKNLKLCCSTVIIKSSESLRFHPGGIALICYLFTLSDLIKSG